MLTVSLILQSLILILGVLLGFIFKNYLPKYFEEKGKNLATKEDIGDITKIVEGIKSDFNKDIEFFKAQWALSNQNRFSIKSAERDALFNMNEKVSSWIFSIMAIDFNFLDEEDYDVSKELNLKKYELEIAQARLNLFMHDQQLLDLTKELILKTIDLHGLILSTSIDLKHAHAIFKIKCSGHTPEENFKLKKEFYAELKEKAAEFQKSKIEEFQKVHDARIPLIKLLRERIYKIVEEENVLISPSSPATPLSLSQTEANARRVL